MRYANCHPDKKHYGHGLCRPCYYRKRYHEKRAQGVPYWAAADRTPKGWIGHIKSVRKWTDKNPDLHAKWNLIKHQRYRDRFGGDVSKNMAARIRWLAAKDAARSKPSAGIGVNGAATLNDFTRCKNKRPAKGAGKDTGKRQAKDMRVPGGRRNKAKKEKS